MCGLFGWQFNKATLPSKRKRRKLAKALTWHMDKRGGQAWGVWADGRVVKGLGDANPQVQHFARTAVLMGHTRYATHGDKTNLDHAHPFRSDKLLLSHNGVLSNHATLNAKHSRKCEVDSQHLLHHIAEGKTFEDIEGYGVVTFVDENFPDMVKLIRLRDRGDLAIAQTSFGVIWASTRDAVNDALEFAGIEAEMFYEIDPGKVYMAEQGKLFYDSTAPDMKVKEPTYYHDWRSGMFAGVSRVSSVSHWWDRDDDDVTQHWDMMASRPTPPVAPIRLAPEVSDPMEWDLAWETEALADEAKLWIEEVGGVSAAAFDGMTDEQVIDAALEMGWEGSPLTN